MAPLSYTAGQQKLHPIAIEYPMVAAFSPDMKLPWFSCLKCYYDQKITFIFLRISKLCLLNTPQAKL